MSYGFEARNAAGEIVIDDSFPVYELTAPSTITGTVIGNIVSFPLPPTGTLRFWKLNVGDGISLAPDRFIGTKNTYTIRDVVRASSLPDPTGYGVVIYNASGEKVYATNGELLTIGEKYTVQSEPPFDLPLINVSDNWVAIETFVPNIIDLGTGTGVVLSSGVERFSSTQMRFFGRAFLSAPGIFFLNPVTFITAK